MKKVNFKSVILMLLFTSALSIGASNYEKDKTKSIDDFGAKEINAANRLWTAFGSNPSRPAVIPRKITGADLVNVDRIAVDRNQASLQNAIKRLLTAPNRNCSNCLGNGGAITFKNKGVIKINSLITLPRQFKGGGNFHDRTVVIFADGITFDGQNRTTVFKLENNVRLIIQGATFKNARFSKNLVSATEFKDREGSGGGAILVKGKASVRAHDCSFLDNKVVYSKGMDTPGDGGGENYGGGAIRLENFSNGEIFNCYFKGNEGFTGGAIGGTSINSLTIVNSLFEGNISTGYKDSRAYGTRKFYVKEGGGALRVDRTIKTIQVHGTSFVGNMANTKVTTVEVFGLPVAGKPKPALTLNIDNCIFKNNGYYKFKGEPFNRFQDRGGVLSSMVFHAGSGTAKMKMTNTVFDGNEVGQANVRMINNFDFKNVTFANTKFYKDKYSNFDKSALWLQTVKVNSTIDGCIFYNNRSNGKELDTKIGSEIAGWNAPSANRVVLKNSIFYGVGGNSPLVGVAKSSFTRFNKSGSVNNIYFVKNYNNSRENLMPVSKTGARNVDPKLRIGSVSKYYAKARKTIRAVNYTRSSSRSSSATKSAIIVENSSKEIYKDNLFPNPAADIITLEGTHINGLIVVKKGLSQEASLTLNNSSKNNSVSLDVSSLTSGQLYTVYVNGRLFKRFIKK